MVVREKMLLKWNTSVRTSEFKVRSLTQTITNLCHHCLQARHSDSDICWRMVWYHDTLTWRLVQPDLEFQFCAFMNYFLHSWFSVIWIGLHFMDQVSVVSILEKSYWNNIHVSKYYFYAHLWKKGTFCFAHVGRSVNRYVDQVMSAQYVLTPC